MNVIMPVLHGYSWTGRTALVYTLLAVVSNVPAHAEGAASEITPPVASPSSPSADAPRNYRVGLVIVDMKGLFVIKGTVEHSPAAEIGVQEGDILVEVDGKPTKGLTFAEVLKRIKGTDPTPVRIGVERNAKLLSFTIRREAVDEMYGRLGVKLKDNQFVSMVESPEVAVGGDAPAVQGTDWDTGKPVDLTAYRGEYVLLSFWTTWCRPCKEEMTGWKQLLARFGKPPTAGTAQAKGHGLVVIGISLDEDKERFSEFLKRGSFATHQVFDGGWFGSNSRLYHAYRHGVPWSVLVGPDGKIEALELRGKELEKAVQERLQQKR